MEETKALFFPAEEGLKDSFDYGSLKRALVYFDHVVAIVPELIFSEGDYRVPGFYLPPMAALEEIKQRREVDEVWWSRCARIHKFVDSTQMLREEGILSYVEPVQNLCPKRTHFYSLPGATVSVKSPEDIDAYLPEILFKSIVADITDTGFRTTVGQLGLAAC